MANGFGNIKKFFDATVGPPQEGIKLLRELTGGETGQKLDKLLSRVEHISKDASALPEILELLKLIEQMNKSGALDKLITLLSNLPKGKQGQVLVTELGKVMAELGPRLDKLSALASTLLGKE